ncbi:Flp family type IVb pilin [Nocardioides yefusunii]|uniref:Flp family type IVb pilin n=1 Tax=Nocardioides yefusunii TaxID=2500546 RepID=A0ABW1QUZ5_9ACTN|nr:Flp family type IVb pilin [Nocardioides yefusunii]
MPLTVSDKECPLTRAKNSKSATSSDESPREDETGASAVEYGLLVAGIAAVVVIAVFVFGDALTALMSDSCGTITAWVQGSCSGPSTP